MAKRSDVPKRRTREHVIADLAFNFLERHVLHCGHTMHRVIQDYGLDATIRTFARDGTMESGAIWVQLKATDTVRPLKNTPGISVRVERRDLLSWLRELYPVILLLYDGKGDQAYWLHLQADLGRGRVFALGQEGATVTLHLHPEQRLTEKAVRLWRSVKNRTLTPWQE